ncbi:MAG: CinA family protein, partial [Fusobacteriales bacterium]|nr:CinA family protein [Fusobacteriales bacterium]
MKNILIGVSGGIAAYKAANIVSGLRKRGYDVKVVMTENAAKIITPLAFESLSKHDVAVDMWERNFNVNVEHIALADWADIILVAPATYNIVGKTAGGIADDMLSTVISAFNKTVYFALAMNVKMYENPILAENIKKLLDSDVGISFTGVAGPDELEGNPVGTVFVGLALPGREPFAKKLTLGGM